MATVGKDSEKEFALREDISPLVFKDFQGLASPNKIPERTQQGGALTRDLINVHMRAGKMFSRGGETTLGSAAAAAINALFDYDRLGVVKLIRIKTAGMDQFNTGTSAWDAITPDVAWSGAVDDFPDWIVFKDDLYFIPTEDDKLYKWTGSGGSTEVAASPGGRVLLVVSGFLMIAYIDGTNPRQVRFSADGSTWSVTDVLNLEETPGPIKRAKAMGDAGYFYKSSSIDQVKHIGTSNLVFAQGTVSEFIGIGAPLTLQGIRSIGHIFMAEDAQLYVNNEGAISPVIMRVNDHIKSEINFAGLAQSFATVDQFNSVYSIFYPTAALTNSLRRIDLNYRTGEVEIHDFSKLSDNLHRGTYTKQRGSTPVLVAAGATTTPEVYEFEQGVQDNGVGFRAYWTTDWVSVRPFETYQLKVVLNHKSQGRVIFKLASGLNDTFQQLKEFKLDTRKSGEDEIAVVMQSTNVWIKARLDIIPATAFDDIEVQEFSIELPTGGRGGGQVG